MMAQHAYAIYTHFCIAPRSVCFEHGVLGGKKMALAFKEMESFESMGNELSRDVVNNRLSK